MNKIRKYSNIAQMTAQSTQRIYEPCTLEEAYQAATAPWKDITAYSSREASKWSSDFTT